jgi:hypothetical protein
MTKPPFDIVEDYNFYKTSNLMQCQHCGEMRANFTHLKFEKGLIYFYLNCAVGCGENSFYYVSKKQLKTICAHWLFDSKIDPDSPGVTICRMFRLGRYFMTCFRSKKDHRAFSEFWLYLNKHLKRWAWWYKYKFERRIYATRTQKRH